MRFVRRLLGLVLVLVLVALVAFGGVLVWTTARGLPQRTGSARLPGLSAEATVVRDANGIVQITAASAADLFAAQGYVHAAERMWQMDVWRHISSGTLSELFGKSQLDTDRFVRTLGWRPSAERDLAAATPDARAALDAYARGVNAWLDQHHDMGLPFVISGLLGAGGGLAGYHPAPWTAVDSIAWAKVEAWQLGGNLDTEIFNLLATAKLGGDAAKLLPALAPGYGASQPVIVPSGAPGSGGAGAGPTGTRPTGAGTGAAAGATLAAAAGDPADAALPVGAALPVEAGDLLALDRLSSTIAVLSGVGQADGGLAGQQGLGSNDWVVAGGRTASGSPLLANDPHLGFSLPSVWYIVGLHCRPISEACPYDVAGVSFPGDPGVVLGHNARIAWGFTNVNPDVQDLFVEQLDPADPSRYLYKGQSLPFDVRSEQIRVAGGEPVSLTVRSTVHGPVVSEIEPPLRPVDQGGSGLAAVGYVYALRWTATATVDHTLEFVLAVDRAHDWATFRAAVAFFGAPGQNVVYADVDGHIGYQMSGLIPVRAGAATRLPVPGWDGAHDWTGYVPFDQLPRLYDPPSGVIVTANNAVVDSRYPIFIGQEWDPGYRAARILQLLAATPKLTPADMSRIQADDRMGFAADVVPALTGAAPATDDGRTVLARIQAWAGGGADAFQCTTDSTGCAAFNVFAYRLLRGLFDPRLGGGTAATDIARLYVGGSLSAQALVALLAQPGSPWWDDPATAAHETQVQVLAAALDAAGHDLRTALGDPAGWRWGDLHRVRFDEATLGSSGIAPLEALFDRGPYPDDGGNFVVNQQYFSVARAYPDPLGSKDAGADLLTTFSAQGGPSYRLVVDMGALDAATIVIPTGQSGVPFDAHYGDLIARYLAHETVPFPFTAASVAQAATETLTLTP